MLLDKPPHADERGKLLIDGDIVAYRAACSPKSMNDMRLGQVQVDKAMSWILYQCLPDVEVDDYTVYLTGDTNFRNEVGVTHKYKGNRPDARPSLLTHLKAYLIDNYVAVKEVHQEADDGMAIAATKLGPKSIIASIDKDMLQVPCLHYNFNTNDWSRVSEWEGLKFFYSQVLTGDTVDNIIGLRSVGPVKAAKILADCTTEYDMYLEVVNAYNGDFDRVLENARLLWLRRYDNQMWEPPE